MTWTWRDITATVLVAVAAVVYFVYLAVGNVLFVDDVADAAIVGLVCGWASRFIGGRRGFASRLRWRIAVPGGFVSLGLGIAAVTTGNGTLLAVFMVSIFGLWALAQFDRWGATRGHRAGLGGAAS